jgi:Uma2 family endonuclease
MELSLDLSKPKEGLFSYADYLGWSDGVRRELFDGVVHAMEVPSWEHQYAVSHLVTELGSLSDSHSGKYEVFTSPFEVRLPMNGETSDDRIRTVVQPDVCVICDLSKLSGSGCVGTPDLVIEVESSSTLFYDINKKYHLYERHGVREYWGVYPLDHLLHAFVLVDGRYGDGVEYQSGLVPVSIFGGTGIELDAIFPVPLEPGS